MVDGGFWKWGHAWRGFLLLRNPAGVGQTGRATLCS